MSIVKWEESRGPQPWDPHGNLLVTAGALQLLDPAASPFTGAEALPWALPCPLLPPGHRESSNRALLPPQGAHGTLPHPGWMPP